ncbi:hypothetical protein [Sulfuriferula nivalis]|uniref:hypothetical protein n=1 Tax=Sulfuriferula nivalis TaxID=2675298 RepID=UPI001389AA48|nr:hypothetical protein [Sulfuriferula nivalis]
MLDILYRDLQLMAHSRPSTCVISYLKVELQARKDFESDSAQTNWVACIVSAGWLVYIVTGGGFAIGFAGGFQLELLAGLGCNMHRKVRLELQ